MDLKKNVRKTQREKKKKRKEKHREGIHLGKYMKARGNKTVMAKEKKKKKQLILQRND